MSTAHHLYSVEQINGRWACVAGTLALMCDSQEEAKRLKSRLIASTLRQRELDRKRGLIS